MKQIDSFQPYTGETAEELLSYSAKDQQDARVRAFLKKASKAKQDGWVSAP